MSFSDMDLKRLKDMGKAANLAPMSEALTGTMTATKEALAFNQELMRSVDALIARLEAAEKALGTDCYANGDCVLCKVHHEAYLRWRKEAGK